MKSTISSDIKLEDLIEHSLTYGCLSASKRFKLTLDATRQALIAYGKENGSIVPCHCEQAAMRGESIMCFMCTGGSMPDMYHKALNS